MRIGSADEAAAGRGWWRHHLGGAVDRPGVIARVEEDAGWSGRYVLMTLASAGIAILGLLQSSPAVVIGAMLISPLMGPIMGFGFALALFDFREMRRPLSALAAGALIAVVATALVVLVSPLQTVTPEIAARTRPNLFDLLIAIFSALAGGYATIRGRSGTIVGVAIATALMPPLATVGFGLATWNQTVFTGALFLFGTNFIAIALTVALVARLYGFGSALSPTQTRLQGALLIGVFAVLAVPLALALRQIAWESLASREIRDALLAPFPADARLSQTDIDFDAHPISIGAVVLTPKLSRAAGAQVGAALKAELGRPVAVHLDQVRVGGGSGEGEAAQLAAAQADAQAKKAADDHAADDAAARLALVAGVDADAVTIDPAHHVAVARAAPLPGATLAAYRQLETRAAAGSAGWQVRLVPPADLALPTVTFSGDAPDPDAIALAAWAATRVGLPLVVSGASKAHAAALVEALTAAGATARAGRARTRGQVARLAWDLAPPAQVAP